jgi:hypothetical protein
MITRLDPSRRGTRRDARRPPDALLWIVAVTGLVILAIPLLHRLFADATVVH